MNTLTNKLMLAVVAMTIPCLPFTSAAAQELSLEERGRAYFSACRSCHSVGPGEPHRTGPDLFGVFGARAAAGRGYPYSQALRAAGLVWSEAALDAWIADPASYVPGNRMAYAGLRDTERRRAIVAFLRSVSPPPQPSPR